MGLDQYLMRKCNNDSVEEMRDIEEIYWRKSNFVHKFFFDKHFDEDEYEWGDDNCTPIPTSRDELWELWSLCHSVLANKSEAEHLLPTMSGFFFGDTEYGDWYYHDVEYTLNEVGALLARANADDEFYYYAWY